MKRIKLKSRKGNVRAITSKGTKSAKVREYLKKHSIPRQTRLLEVDGVTRDIGGITAILKKEEPGFFDFLESQDYLAVLAPYGEPVRKRNKKSSPNH
jgi:hypothetical protein